MFMLLLSLSWRFYYNCSIVTFIQNIKAFTLTCYA